MMLLLDPTPFARGLVRKKVEVVNYPDGRFAVQFEGIALPFRVFDKIQTVEPGAIVENKRLGAALALVKEQQAPYPPNRRRDDPGAAAAAKQSRGTGYADKGPAFAPGSRRGVGRTAGAEPADRPVYPIVHRYVTEKDDAKRPQTRGRSTAEQR